MISVIVPVYNVAGFVGPCLDSLKAQSFTDFEAIIVDDGSTDASRDEIVGVIAGDARFRLFSGRNGGLSAARNIGLTLARGAFVAFLDGDDRFAPEFLGRMLAALLTSGADWVACGLRYVAAGADSGPEHSAIHAAPDLPPEADALTVQDFSDWRGVVGHFPSAWNKLYRRALIDGLRFDVGTYYEDHAFYWQVAARAGQMLHLAAPLVLHTVAREGQITRDGGERVFDQFAVLDRLAGLLPGLQDRRNGQAALAELAVRLIFERGQVIADPARRARFAAKARDWLDARGIDWQALRPQAPLDPFARVLLGRRLLTVVVPSDGAFAPLRASLDSLMRQDMQDFDILVVSDGRASVADLAQAARAAGADWRVTILGPDVRQPGGADMGTRVATARNRGLAAAEGDFIVFLDAGDQLLPQTLSAWCAAMMAAGGAEGADFGFSAYHIGAVGRAGHAGVHDAEALAGLSATVRQLEPDAAVVLHAMPSAKIFRRGFLQQDGISFPPHGQQAAAVVLRAALAAKVVLRLPGLERAGVGPVIADEPESRRFWRGGPEAATLVAEVDALTASLPEPLTPALDLRLLTRAIWEKAQFSAFSSAETRQAFLMQARAIWRARRAALADEAGLFDPYMAPTFRAFLHLESDSP